MKSGPSLLIEKVKNSLVKGTWQCTGNRKMLMSVLQLYPWKLCLIKYESNQTLWDDINIPFFCLFKLFIFFCEFSARSKKKRWNYPNLKRFSKIHSAISKQNFFVDAQPNISQDIKIKGTVSVISSDTPCPPCKDGNARFTMVPLKALSD